MREKLGKSCTLWFCNDPHYAHGLCHRHYMNVRKYGTSISPKNSDLITVLNMINVLQGLLPNDVEAPVLEGTQNAINIVAKCDACKMDTVAVLNWPWVTLVCGCNSGAAVNIDDASYEMIAEMKDWLTGT